MRCIVFICIVASVRGGIVDFFNIDDMFFSIWNTNRDNTGDVACGSLNEGTCTSRTDCHFTNGYAGYDSKCGYLKTCCVVASSCNSQSSSKVSYFKYDVSNKGKQCKFTLNVMENVCQLRLDFIQFDMAQATPNNPNLLTMYNCVNQSLSVDVQDSVNRLQLCGYNTNQHVYIHLKNKQRQVNFDVASSTTDANAPNLHMKVTQLICPTTVHSFKKSGDFKLLAPAGCRQYYTNRTSDIVNLGHNPTANTNDVTATNSYAICFQRTENTCTIKYNIKLIGGTNGHDNQPPSCENYLYIPGKKYNGNSKICLLSGSIPPPQEEISHTPGLFFLYFANPKGTGIFELSYEIHQACEIV